MNLNPKKILILNETQFKNLVNEELGISRNVIKITKIIEKKVYEFLDKNEIKESIQIFDDLILEVKKVYFNNIYEFYDTYQKDNNVYNNSYSFLNKTLYITILIINNKLCDFENLENAIQHEVHHYWQCKMKGSGLSSPHYQELFELIKDSNIYISTIGQLLYYSKRFEIDTQINGAFNELKNKEIKNIDDIFNKTELGVLKNRLLDIKNKVSSWNYESYSVEYALNTINVNNLIRRKTNKMHSKPFNKTKLISIIERTIDYFFKKVAKLYSLYIEKEKYFKIKEFKEKYENRIKNI